MLWDKYIVLYWLQLHILPFKEIPSFVHNLTRSDNDEVYKITKDFFVKINVVLSSWNFFYPCFHKWLNSPIAPSHIKMIFEWSNEPKPLNSNVHHILILTLLLSLFSPSCPRPESDSSSESRSRSRTPGNDKITFITSFGGSEDEGATAAQPPPAAASSQTSSNTAGHSRGSRSVTSPFYSLAP